MKPVGIAAKRIVTGDPARCSAENPLGVIEDGVVVYDEEGIRSVGRRASVGDVPVVDHGDRVITAGLVDAHTHAAWVGSRHDEYAMRMAGADYRAIAAAGGGILSSFRAVAAASEDEITDALIARLRRMAALGVTSCEVKSGYGLEPEGERKQLRAIRRARTSFGVPTIVATYLALHALPESARADREAYVERAASVLVPEMAREGLAAFVDAYVDQNAFTIAEARAVCEAARKAGLGVRLHIGQFADIGGAKLCADLGAKSADHVEHIDAEGIALLAKHGVAAVLLPVASFTLGQTPPPVAALREAGVMMVIASDANPGTAPSESLPLAMAMAVRLYGMTPAEVLLGATRHAATSLGLWGEGIAKPRGALVAGACADLVVWDLPHEHALVQPWGGARTWVVVRDGVQIAGVFAS